MGKGIKHQEESYGYILKINKIKSVKAQVTGDNEQAFWKINPY